jgi:hypothetical protein
MGVTPIEVSNKKNTQGNTPIFTTEQLLGKWQEVARIEKPGTQIIITDTIFLHFTTTDAVITKRGNEFAYKGAVEIAPPGNELLVAGDIYTIVSISADHLIVDNQENVIHTLKKVN